MNSKLVAVALGLLVGGSLLYIVLSGDNDDNGNAGQNSSPPVSAEIAAGQSEVLPDPVVPSLQPELSPAPVKDMTEAENTAQHVGKKVAGDDTPPWPSGTEDRLYQAIAEHLWKYPITGIISVDCEGHLCTILMSTPDTDLAGTGIYSGMMNDIRASGLDIGGSSVGVVEYSPGVNVIMLRVDNIEWTPERLRRAREQ